MWMGREVDADSNGSLPQWSQCRYRIFVVSCIKRAFCVKVSSYKASILRRTLEFKLLTDSRMSSTNIHTGTSPFLCLAPELKHMVFAYLGPPDRLSTLLVSHDFKANAEAQIPRHPITRAEFAHAHTTAEADLRHHRCGPAFLVCTQCCRFLNRSRFGDAQYKKKMPGRLCIQCGILYGHYTSRVFRVGNQKCFGCQRCVLALPVEQRYIGNIYQLCLTYRYPRKSLLCKRCFPLRLKEVLGCSWETLRDVGRVAVGMIG